MESHRNISSWSHSNVNVTARVFHSRLSEDYLYSGVLAAISLIGVLLNGTLVFTFARHRTIRTVRNMYIFSLALGDLLVIFICVCFNFGVLMTDSCDGGELICKLLSMTRDISLGGAVFSLTALSGERYCAIVDPIRNHSPSKSHSIITVTLIWVISVVLALPEAISSSVVTVFEQHNYTIKLCSSYSREYSSIYVKVTIAIKFLAYYVIPLCFITGFYGHMSRQLMLSTRTIPGEHSLCRDQSNQIQARKKAAKIVLSLAIIFMMCYLPNNIYMLFANFHPSSFGDFEVFWNAFRIVAFWLSYIYSCINPIALYFMSKAFRQYFNQYLFCCVKAHR